MKTTEEFPQRAPSFDESAQSWRITSKAEPNFQRTFAFEQAAFYFWYSRFDRQTGMLRPE
jgi:hypothetical protein